MEVNVTDKPIYELLQKGCASKATLANIFIMNPLEIYKSFLTIVHFI